jgi:hypothetical protein
MKIAKTALVSTISLGIAMSTAALAASPSFFEGGNTPARQKATERPRLPITGKQVCASNLLTFPSAVSTDAQLGITFFIGAPKPVALLFSTEIAESSGTIFLDYSIDGGAPIPIGPEFFSSNDPIGSARTAYGVVMPPFVSAVLPAGTHTIKPFLRANTSTGAVKFRCFSVLNTGV